MLMRPRYVGVSAACLLALMAGAACGQTPPKGTGHAYPAKPIRMLSSAPGGSSDVVARMITPALSANLGQQIIVDNRGGFISVEILTKAPPDGYTLLYFGSSLWLAPFLRSNVPYDPVRDFSPVALAVSAPTILVVHAAVAANSVKDLIALAKTKPGALNYSSGPSGSATHLAAELLKSMAGINMVRIPYKGQGPALNALLGAEVQLTFPSAGSVMTHVKAGKIRALAITSAEPSSLFPGLPTLAAAGVPGYESVQMSGIFSAPRTPKAIVDQLNREIVRVLNSADVKDRFSSSGLEAVGGSPEQFADKIKSEMTRMGKVIKDAGIKEE